VIYKTLEELEGKESESVAMINLFGGKDEIV